MCAACDFLTIDADINWHTVTALHVSISIIRESSTSFDARYDTSIVSCGSWLHSYRFVVARIRFSTSANPRETARPALVSRTNHGPVSRAGGQSESQARCTVAQIILSSQ